MLMTLQQFRDKRDQNALDGYYIRWPILTARKNTLKKQIDNIDRILKCLILTESGKKNFNEDRIMLYWEYGDVTSQLAQIETDAPIRKMNLGLMPIPTEPTPEMKMRLTVFLLQVGKEMLLKGIPE